MNKRRSVVILLIFAALLVLYGCGPAFMATNTVSAITISHTPTASVGGQAIPKDSEPAFALLRETQKAMQSVTSYSFKLNNSTDTHMAAELTQAPIIHVPTPTTLIQGDVMPPLARYIDDSPNYYWASGKNTYFTVSNSKEYVPLGEASDPFIITGALNNPQEYINFTLDTAACATIVGDEKVAGFDTIHLKFILPTDSIGMHGNNSYARDIWIDKDTHYLRQIQMTEIFQPRRPWEDALTASPSEISYTSGILLYLKYNEEITPPIEAPLERVPAKP